MFVRTIRIRCRCFHFLSGKWAALARRKVPAMLCPIDLEGMRVIDGVTIGAKTVLLRVKQMIVRIGYTDEGDQ